MGNRRESIMLEIEMNEPITLRRVNVQDVIDGDVIFWAHITMYIEGEYITLVSDGEFDNSLYGEYREIYKGLSEEEAVKRFVSYMKEEE
jgi:hypothetical protein